jgi:hypothetical protein
MPRANSIGIGARRSSVSVVMPISSRTSSSRSTKFTAMPGATLTGPSAISNA